ncbi:SGNH hydrolase-type esterase superfamily protein [Euphorbia peplus]|nr:SGNH hydrolase-type esterase superfamily protein [Euphorbia peplus]
MVGPGRPQIVLFGSSIVEFCYSNNGWGAILSNFYSRKADIILRGYAGWNSRRALQVLHQVFPKDAIVQPDLVIVYFGGNDSINPHSSGLGPHVPLSEYIRNMKNIAIHLQSLSKKTRIIFLSTPPVNEEQINDAPSKHMFDVVRTNESCRIYSEACLELCREMNIEAVDLWNAAQQIPNWKDVCFTDGTHFSSEGSKIVAHEILKVIGEANWEPSLHWKDIPLEFADDSPYDPVGTNGNTVNVSKLVDLYKSANTTNDF